MGFFSLVEKVLFNKSEDDDVLCDIIPSGSLDHFEKLVAEDSIDGVKFNSDSEDEDDNHDRPIVFID